MKLPHPLRCHCFALPLPTCHLPTQHPYHPALQGHCWVLADNAQLEPPRVIDSRAFGLLPLSAIVGRVLYCARSHTDHGPVENSEEGMAADAPVLEAELDVEALCSD